METRKIAIKKNSIVLFQGDSVTDCHRNREDENDLGNSYVKYVNSYLKDFNIKVINKAISGNRVDHLLQRFDNDFKAVNPDYLFLLIGVNDTWHNFPNNKDDVTFYNEFDLLLTKISKEMNCNIILLEPFIIGYNKETTIMRKDLLGKIEIIRDLAKKYKCEYITFENDIAEILVSEDDAQYSLDGIHPFDITYQIMAKKIISKIDII